MDRPATRRGAQESRGPPKLSRRWTLASPRRDEREERWRRLACVIARWPTASHHTTRWCCSTARGAWSPHEKIGRVPTRIHGEVRKLANRRRRPVAISARLIQVRHRRRRRTLATRPLGVVPCLPRKGMPGPWAHHPRWSENRVDKPLVIRPLGAPMRRASARSSNRCRRRSLRFRYSGRAIQRRAEPEDYDLDFPDDGPSVPRARRPTRSDQRGPLQRSARQQLRMRGPVRDDWHHRGLGTTMMKHLIEVARARGICSWESVDRRETSRWPNSPLHRLHPRDDPQDRARRATALCDVGAPPHDSGRIAVAPVRAHPRRS